MKASRENAVIVDTGPLVAVLDSADQRHTWCAEVMERLTLPLLTTEPVLTEAFWHLRHAPAALDGLCEMIAAKDLIVFAMDDPAAVGRYAARYGGDLADASVVALSENHPAARVFTVDFTDFRVYRRFRNQPIPLIEKPRR